MARKRCNRRGKVGGKEPGHSGTGLLVPRERIGRKILVIRAQKVLVDSDLAELYGVETEAINQAVKRNAGRFPEDFMFRLTPSEKEEVITNCEHLARLKFSRQLPLAFTEQGVAMLSSVLRSKRAVAVNVEIMRTFVRLRHLIGSNEALARQIEALDTKFKTRTKEHAAHIKQIYELLDQLINPPEPPKKRRIGFHPTEAEAEIAESGSSASGARKRGGHKL